MGLILVVDAAIVDKAGRVLMVKNRKNYDLLNGWILPGGKVSNSESLEDAIKREIREECGIVVRPDKIISVFVSPLSVSGKVKDVFVIVGFLASPETTTELKTAEAEISEAQWFPLDSLPADSFPDSLKQLRDGGLIR